MRQTCERYLCHGTQLYKSGDRIKDPGLRGSCLGVETNEAYLQQHDTYTTINEPSHLRNHRPHRALQMSHVLDIPNRRSTAATKSAPSRQTIQRSYISAKALSFAARHSPAYKNHAVPFALHAQHWWFSGKIGRCQLKSFKSSNDIGQPRVRFPADASHTHSLRVQFSFAFCSPVSSIGEQGTVSWTGKRDGVFQCRQTLFQRWRCWLAGWISLAWVYAPDMSLFQLFLISFRASSSVGRYFYPPLSTSLAAYPVIQNALSFIIPGFGTLSSSIGGLVVKLAVAI